MAPEGEEVGVEGIIDVKIDKFPNTRGPYLQFLTHYTGDIDHEWSLLHDVNECAALGQFLTTRTWRDFAKSTEYQDFAARYPRRAVQVLN